MILVQINAIEEIYMKKYTIMLSGTDLTATIEGIVKNLGYFTTRFIEADDETSAISKAIYSVRKEIENQFPLTDINTHLINIESSYEVESFGEHTPPGKGFTLYINNPRLFEFFSFKLIQSSAFYVGKLLYMIKSMFKCR